MPGLDSFTFSENSNCVREILLEVSKAKHSWALTNLLPQVNFPANDLNFHWMWRWRDQIQAIFSNLFCFNNIFMQKNQRRYDLLKNKMGRGKIQTWHCESLTDWSSSRTVVIVFAKWVVPNYTNNGLIFFIKESHC